MRRRPHTNSKPGRRIRDSRPRTASVNHSIRPTRPWEIPCPLVVSFARYSKQGDRHPLGCRSSRGRRTAPSRFGHRTRPPSNRNRPWDRRRRAQRRVASSHLPLRRRADCRGLRWRSNTRTASSAPVLEGAPDRANIPTHLRLDGLPRLHSQGLQHSRASTDPTHCIAPRLARRRSTLPAVAAAIFRRRLGLASAQGAPRLRLIPESP
jgi:hypothetical protein